jgi:hypothetical protein
MIGHPGRRECSRNGLFRGAFGDYAGASRRAGPGPRSGHPGGAAEQLLRGLDEPGVVRAAAAAETPVEGVHARVAQHGGGFGIGHVERARGRAGREQLLEETG